MNERTHIFAVLLSLYVSETNRSILNWQKFLFGFYTKCDSKDWYLISNSAIWSSTCMMQQELILIQNDSQNKIRLLLRSAIYVKNILQC